MESSRQKVIEWLNNHTPTVPLDVHLVNNENNSFCFQHSAYYEIPSERRKYVDDWLERLHEAKPIPIHEDLDSTNSVETSSSSTIHSPRLNQMYTTEERDAIIKYITENDALRFTTGNMLWKIMAMDNVCKRSWESMRSYFFRKLNSIVKNHFKEREKQSRAKSHLLRPGDRGWSRYTRYYSISEDMDIIHYLLEKKMLPYVIRNKIWMRMESKEIILGRSWRSLKIRFLKYILNNLENYNLSKNEYKLLSITRTAVKNISKYILSTKILRSPPTAMSNRFSEVIKLQLRKEHEKHKKEQRKRKYIASCKKFTRDLDAQQSPTEKPSGDNNEVIDMELVTSSDDISLCRTSHHPLDKERDITNIEQPHTFEKNNKSSECVSRRTGPRQSPNHSQFKSCDSGFSSYTNFRRNPSLNDIRQINENISILPYSATSFQTVLVNKDLEICSNDGNSSVHSLRHHHYQLNKSYETTPKEINVSELCFQSPKIMENSDVTSCTKSSIIEEQTSIARPVLNKNFEASKHVVDSFVSNSSNFNRSHGTCVYDRSDKDFALCDTLLSTNPSEIRYNGDRVHNNHCSSVEKEKNTSDSVSDAILENGLDSFLQTNNKKNEEVHNMETVFNSLGFGNDSNSDHEGNRDLRNADGKTRQNCLSEWGSDIENIAHIPRNTLINTSQINEMSETITKRYVSACEEQTYGSKNKKTLLSHDERYTDAHSKFCRFEREVLENIGSPRKKIVSSQDCIEMNDILAQNLDTPGKKDMLVNRAGTNKNDEEAYMKENVTFYGAKAQKYHSPENCKKQSVQMSESEDSSSLSNNLEGRNYDENNPNYFGLLSEVFLDNLSLKVMEKLEKENENHCLLGQYGKHESNENNHEIPLLRDYVFSPVCKESDENYLSCDSYKTNTSKNSKSTVERDGCILMRESSSTYSTCSSNSLGDFKDKTNYQGKDVKEKYYVNGKSEQLNVQSKRRHENCTNSFSRKSSLHSSPSTLSDRTIRHCFDTSDITINSLSRLHTPGSLSERSIPDTPDTCVFTRSNVEKLHQQYERKSVTHVNRIESGNQTNFMTNKTNLDKMSISTPNESSMDSHVQIHTHENKVTDSSYEYKKSDRGSRSVTPKQSISDNEKHTCVSTKLGCENYITEIRSQDKMTNSCPTVKSPTMNVISRLEYRIQRNLDLEDCETFCPCNSAGKKCYKCYSLDYLSPSSD